MDAIYTPERLVRILTSLSSPTTTPSTIADFSAGDGRLLVAAEERFPTAEMIAVDIDGPTVARLRRSRPHWNVCQADFLSKLTNASQLSRYVGRVDLVLLNPPFSCRGGKRVVSDLDGNEISSSLAMAFVLRALKFLSPAGEIIAILPAGSFQSEKDHEARMLIERKYQVDVLGWNGKRTFANCTTSTLVARLSKREAASRINGAGRSGAADGKGPLVLISRGRVGMHTVAARKDKSGVALVHTTNIHDGHIRNASPVKIKCENPAMGPAVLVPRVGRPTVDKVCLLASDENYALSDCLLALLCEGVQDAKTLKRQIVRNWELFSSQYGGTGAPYITVARVTRVLTDLGFNVASIH